MTALQTRMEENHARPGLAQEDPDINSIVGLDAVGMIMTQRMRT
jgi:hypothetical protein